MDSIEFLVSANAGQPVQPLGKVASGGELSRISLSIQVISADSEKLRALGVGRQVLCVTHLPQVAALAHQQMQVSKLSSEDTTHTRIRPLEGAERVDELARMLGGIKITRQTREHAREMMELGQKQQASVKPVRRKA